MDDSKLDDRRIKGKLEKLYSQNQEIKSSNESVEMMKARNAAIRLRKNVKPRTEDGGQQ